jgi:hypothetical protein
MISARLTTAGIRDGRKLMPSGELSHKSEEETMKLAAYTITALAFAGALAMVSPARAEEMQASGTSFITQVESHFIPEAGDPIRGFGIEKFVGAVTSPGWFDAVQETVVQSSQVDLKAGRSEDKGFLYWRNADGTMTNSIVGKATFTMDEKTNAPKGTSEGTIEFNGGTGRFANVRGHGTFKAEFNGGNATVHWNATITGFKKQASTQ